MRSLLPQKVCLSGCSRRVNGIKSCRKWGEWGKAGDLIQRIYTIYTEHQSPFHITPACIITLSESSFVYFVVFRPDVLLCVRRSVVRFLCVVTVTSDARFSVVKSGSQSHSELQLFDSPSFHNGITRSPSYPECSGHNSIFSFFWATNSSFKSIDNYKTHSLQAHVLFFLTSTKCLLKNQLTGCIFIFILSTKEHDGMYCNCNCSRLGVLFNSVYRPSSSSNQTLLWFLNAE